MDPVTLGVISAVGTVGSTAMSIFGGLNQAKAAEIAGKQAQVNARAEAADKQLEYERLKARQRALIGASGVQAVGSPLKVMYETAKEAELDVQRIKWQGDQYAAMKKQEASGYRTGALVGGFGGLAKTGGILGQLYKDLYPKIP